MIAVISLGLLGIWTVILGIFNLFGATERSDLGRDLELKKAREPAPIPRPIRSEAKRSEIADALRDLWNEIVGGS